MADRTEKWWNETITWQQHVTELAMMSGASWILAQEAVASTALEHPEAPWGAVRTRREWHARDGEL